jgi:hypothetical protein
MSIIKDSRVEIEFERDGGKKRHLMFSMDVLDEMQDKFGGYDKLAEALKGADMFKNIRWLLCRLINAGSSTDEDPVTEEWIGKNISVANLGDITKLIYAAFNAGVSGDTDPPKNNSTDPNEAEYAELEKNFPGATTA